MRTGLRCSATRASCGATEQRAPVADAGPKLRNAFAASIDVPCLVEADPAMRLFALLVPIRGNGRRPAADPKPKLTTRAAPWSTVVVRPCRTCQWSTFPPIAARPLRSVLEDEGGYSRAMQRRGPGPTRIVAGWRERNEEKNGFAECDKTDKSVGRSSSRLCPSCGVCVWQFQPTGQSPDKFRAQSGRDQAAIRSGHW